MGEWGKRVKEGVWGAASPYLWTKKWLVLGSNMDLARELVARSAALSVIVHIALALLGVSCIVGWTFGVWVCMQQLMHRNGHVDHF